MSRIHFPPLFAWFLMLFSPAAAAEDRKPNVIIIYTDDQGYADIGAAGIVQDIKTPHLDKLAADGARFTHGYVTAPICGPSRAGLMTGRYQQRMGMESHADFPLKLDSKPLATRLREVGYRTGMTGKLHLPVAGDMSESAARWGFDEYWMKAGEFQRHMNRYLMTHDLDGNPIPGEPVWRDLDDMYRINVSNQFAVQFIERNHDKPFFLYVAQFAPHTPIEATERYLSRFPKDIPEVRRHGLAMMAAVDDGIGQIVGALEKHGIADDTVIFFASDNGAPYQNGKPESEMPASLLDNLDGWDGSLNTPLKGEKGMLAEGGIRVPFVAWGPGRVKAAQVIDSPVITLDIAATITAMAGADSKQLDGVDLSSLLAGNAMPGLAERPLFWRFGGADAIRIGPWKLLRAPGDAHYLFDVSISAPESENLIKQQPERAAALARQLDAWTASLGPRGIVSKAQRAATSRRMRAHFYNP